MSFIAASCNFHKNNIEVVKEIVWTGGGGGEIEIAVCKGGGARNHEERVNTPLSCLKKPWNAWDSLCSLPCITLSQ